MKENLSESVIELRWDQVEVTNKDKVRVKVEYLGRESKRKHLSQGGTEKESKSESERWVKESESYPIQGCWCTQTPPKTSHL